MMSMREAAALDPWMLFREDEGLTLILAKAAADKLDFKYDGIFRRITLRVLSSLEAVGLTAAVATTLSKAGISANVVAAYHHDHVYVPAKEAQRALEALQALADAGRRGPAVLSS
ncbi:unnamed protein product [Polarella glacialis]|uniref:Aspartate kinase n=1 Tax=Polarella glacialis TaxID=89957 RepID=A0A813GHW8_POLGL|nr:unnamed protein product [Polarella glacialis]